MKKVLSLTLTLMMLITMICSIPVMAAEADGSAENPYYVTNSTMAPNFITIPANGTVYYQYNAMVFNGWEVGGYGLSAIIVDGVVYDEADKWGEIYAPLNFTMMSPGLVGYVNDTAEEAQVMIFHNAPVGTEDNPAMLEDGDNAFSIPANMMEYMAVYLPVANGDYTFSTEQVEDFQIIVFADAAPAEGGTPNYVEDGSLTLTLESWIPVYIIIAPIGMTGDVVLTVTPPAAGTEQNPIWLDSMSVGNSYVLDAAAPLYFLVSSELFGNILNLESLVGADFTALVDGEEYVSEDGILSVVPESDNWYVDLVLTSEVDNEVQLLVDYAPGTEQNPIELVEGDNEISIPGGVMGYYYSFVVEKDGLLIMTPSVYTMDYLSMADEMYDDFAYLQEGATNVMMPVTAGEVVTIACYTAMDEETFEHLALEAVLNLEVKDLVLFSTFEDGELGGWSSSSNLSVDEEEYISGWYSAKFEVTADWGNIYNYITLEPNTDYTVSFKAKAALEKTLWVKFNNNWGPDVAQADVNLTTEWADYEMVLNSGELGNTVLLLQYAGYGADGQTVWLDDIAITKVASEEPTCEHEYEYDCSTVCTLCGEESRPEAEHTYYYACDAYCNSCGEKTNPKAAHTITHVEAKAPVSCIEYGNKEYWTCSDCGGAWLDARLMRQTNLMSVRIAGDCVSNAALCQDGECVNCGLPCYAEADHEYFYPCDPVCMNCYEVTNPEAAHLVAHVDAVEPTATENGNVEYWYCTACGTAWLDEALAQQTNLKNVVIPATGEITYGDANGDGKVNNRDLGLLQQYLNGIDVTDKNFDEAAADVNGDGKVNNRDLGMLQIYLNGGDVELG